MKPATSTPPEETSPGATSPGTTSWSGALRARLRDLAADTESGQAMTEFVIVFPFQLVLTLMILQFALIANGAILMGHAADMGARAAAVADGMEGVNQTGAAARVAARYLVLTTSPGQEGNFSSERGDALKLRWQHEGGQRSPGDALENQVYTLLNVSIDPGPGEQRQQGYLRCVVRYDFPLYVPVAGAIFSGGASFWWGDAPGLNDASRQRGFHVLPMVRAGFAALPWAGEQ